MPQHVVTHLQVLSLALKFIILCTFYPDIKKRGKGQQDGSMGKDTHQQA